MDWLKTVRAATYAVPGFKFADGGALDWPGTSSNS
jgi:hypothetical protein